MPVQLATNDSTSSDYFEPEDPDFIDALQATVLPGDIVAADPQPSAQEQAESEWAQVIEAGQPSESLKRSHSVMNEEGTDNMAQENSEGSTDDTYGASRFGGFGDYMRRKRAKLQIQNAHMSDNAKDGDAPGEIRSRIFKGIAIYVCFLRAERLLGGG